MNNFEELLYDLVLGNLMPTPEYAQASAWGNLIGATSAIDFLAAPVEDCVKNP